MSNPSDETDPKPATAKIRITANGTPARGFTFAKGAVVDRVPIVHAEFLEKEGKAVILEVQ